MVKVFRKDMLVTAFIIAFFIFLLGFYVGKLFDVSRLSSGDGMILDIQLDTDSFVTEKEFFDVFTVQDCPLLDNRMQKLGENLGEIGRTITKYDARSVSDAELYNKLKRKYFLLELRAYTLRKEMLDSCNGEDSNVILFFYNTKDNQESLNQGYALDSLVSDLNNTIVFSVDSDFEEPALSSLKAYYNITVAPTLVLNYQEKVEGYISEREILELLGETV
ncbi:hypothetical protein HY500_02035 [Candidatus Woesearchaeota archaeon]|nr:hypothetical protein [Candidatus Woesearchaeota archaeon]